MSRSLLFLIADTGGGHRAAATAVADQLHTLYPGEFEIHIVDAFAQAGPRWGAKTTGLYGPLITRGRWLWGGIYHVSNRAPVTAGLRGVLRTMVRGISGLIQQHSVDAIVSFHPLLNHAAVAAARRSGRNIPVATVITDLVSVHKLWACRDVDLVLASSPGGVDRCRRAGVAAGKIIDVGLPVHAAFTTPPPNTRAKQAIRRRLGLNPDLFTVLVCSGADGSGDIPGMASAVAQLDLPLQLVVICGRNQRAKARLEGLTTGRGNAVAVEGYVRNMPDWMHAADIIATKAGPGTIAEALCCGLPILITWYLPGQERGNVEWISGIGAGRYVPTHSSLADAVKELATPNSPVLKRMKQAVRAAARPQAAQRTAEIIRELALGNAADVD